MSYSNYPARRTWRPTATTNEVSDRQRQFIESLLVGRLQTLGLADLPAACKAISLDTLTKSDASTLIERLKAMPTDPDDGMPAIVQRAARKGKGNRPGICSACECLVPQDEGYYYLNDQGQWKVHHKVGACHQGERVKPVVVEPGVYVVGDQFILVYRTQTGHLAGKVWNGRSFKYQQGAVQRAAMGRYPTAAEAAAFGKASSKCCACGRKLEDGRSTTVGYGPVCANKYDWPWGES